MADHAASLFIVVGIVLASALCMLVTKASLRNDECDDGAEVLSRSSKTASLPLVESEAKPGPEPEPPPYTSVV